MKIEITGREGDALEIREATMALSQSEKIKAGLIWLSQAIEISEGLEGRERQGAIKVVQAVCGMVLQEIHIAQTVTGSPSWEEVRALLERAVVMIDSGVPAESVTHLTQALSRVTGAGQQAMTLLKEQGLL